MDDNKSMKKRWLILINFIIAVMIMITFSIFAGKRPYKDLQTSDIVCASVHLGPPDKTVEIIDIEELVTILKDIVIYSEDNSYTEYAGQATSFTLVMKNGSTEKITAYNPFIIINGTGYKAKYEPCERLNNYANKLLKEFS